MSDFGSDFAAFKKKAQPKDEGLWLMSFCDLSLTLLACFALMLSYSTLDKKKFETVSEGMTGVDQPKATVEREQTNNLKTISKEMLAEIKKQKLDATVIYDANGVLVEFKDKLFFASGSAKMNTQYANLTDRLMKIVANSPSKYQLVLEGHTDDQPLGARSIYRSNWDLSSARALAMLNELSRRGVPDNRMSAVAYAHTRPKVPYDKKNGTQLDVARNANRRVAIRIQ
jgi:chemotaxis protein MotB